MVKLPTSSTSHFVNSHFVNSYFVNIDKVGSWPNGNWQSGKLTKWQLTKCELDKVGINLASYPGFRWVGKERAWYPLFAHALNFPEILGNRKLSILTNDGGSSIARSPGFSSSLQRLGTSDMSLNKVQVATSSDFCWENTCLCGYYLVSLCDTTMLLFVIDCKLAKPCSE